MRNSAIFWITNALRYADAPKTVAELTQLIERLGGPSMDQRSIRWGLSVIEQQAGAWIQRSNGDGGPLGRRPGAVYKFSLREVGE